jgi:hypothetical protein
MQCLQRISELFSAPDSCSKGRLRDSHGSVAVRPMIVIANRHDGLDRPDQLYWLSRLAFLNGFIDLTGLAPVGFPLNGMPYESLFQE